MWLKTMDNIDITDLQDTFAHIDLSDRPPQKSGIPNLMEIL